MGKEAIRNKLADLAQEHRDLDDSISALQLGSNFDQLQIQRLKRKKLALRDQLEKLQNMLVPDIIA